MNSSNSMDVQGSLKEALYETLNEILSPHGQTRQSAEQRIQVLEVTEEFGVHLTEFVIDPNSPLAIRQLASVLLKQYVEVHWSSVAEKFRSPELKVTTKERIKALLPIGLRESISKIRTAVAYAISAIACWDWPENWPGLFDILVSCLSGDNKYAVHGAMRVLTEFTRDLSDAQLPNVGPVILQEMYRIIQSENEYSIRTRGRAVEIFTTVASLVAATDIYQKGFTRQYLEPMLPMFCGKFVYCLSMPNGPVSDIGLKTDIVKAINCLILKLPKYVATYLPQMLAPIWDTFTQSAKVYEEEVVNVERDNDDGNDEQVDSDGEIINFNNLIIATFEVISTLLDHRKLSNLLDHFLEDILYYLIIFMQVTDEQIELWTNNPNQFIEEEENTAFVYNVRISAQDLLQGVLNYAEERGVNALWTAINKHLETQKHSLCEQDNCESGSGRSGTVGDSSCGNNNSVRATTAKSATKNWWKLYESSIFALSLGKDFIIEKHRAGHLHFDINCFFNNIVLTTLNDPGAHPLLLGRCLCLGGQYANIMPVEMSSRFIEATVNGLQENQPICIRISAAKTIYSFFNEISASTSITATTTVAITNKDIGSILRSHLPTIFEGLFSLANQPSKEVLTLIMETFSVVISLNQHFTARMESKICPLTIAVLLKYHSDHLISEICQEIFKELSKNSECREPLQTRLIPTLVTMMAINPMDKSKHEECRAIALDTLRVLIQYSPQPLSNLLVETAFPAACHCILNSDDNNTLQSGGELIRTYISVAPRQITERRDNEGRTGLQYVLQIVAQLLNPQSSEFTAVFIGQLLRTLIRKVGSALGENLDLLLKAVLSKMQRTETITVMQSLLMVYAYLINTEFDAVLNFLCTVPGPTGESALTFVLSEWLCRQQMFYGRYDRKVTIVALCKILEYGVTHDDSRLNEINVKGDIIYAENEGVRTRSKSQTQPYQWTSISALVKIFKLIINELSADMEAMSATADVQESDEDDEDETNAEDEEIDPGNNSSNMLRFEDVEDESEDEEDLDLLQDSIYHLNIGQYLRDFLQNFSTHHCFAAFVQHLNTSERKFLNKLNITITFM